MYYVGRPSDAEVVIPRNGDSWVVRIGGDKSSLTILHNEAFQGVFSIEFFSCLQVEIESALKDQKKGPAPDIKPLDSFFLEYVDQMDETFDWEQEPNLYN